MVPTVRFEDPESKHTDRRKQRKTGREEAKVCLSGRPQSKKRSFAATMGTVEEAGDQLYFTATLEGLSVGTQVHCVGDGAPWVASQVGRVFGSNGSFVLDFYHVAECLGEASKTCAPDDSMVWLKRQKERLKMGRTDEAICEVRSTGHSGFCRLGDPA